MKNALILFLIAVLLLPLAACGKPADPDADTTAPAVSDTAGDTAETEAPETGLAPRLPAGLTFDGRDFTFLTGGYTTYCYVTVEEPVGEILNDAQYDMQLRTEERLKVKIIEDQRGYEEANTIAENTVSAGDAAFAAMNLLDRFSVNMMLENYLLPFGGVEYIDLEAPWWLPAVNKELQIGGKNFEASSASNLLMWSNTIGIFINTDLAKNVGVDPDEIFASVREGTWTLDQMMGYAAKASMDLDGDGKFTAKADQFGLTFYYPSTWETSVVRAGGMNSVGKDENGRLTVAWGNEQYAALLEKAYNYFHTDAVWADVFNTTTQFVEGRSLFLHGFFRAVDQMKDMTNDYTLAPMPKADAAQPSYECANYDTMTYNLPKTVSDTALSGAVLEWLSYEGYELVRPAYIESTMKYKNARDERMAEMVQICLDSSMIDIGSIYCTQQCSYDIMYYEVILKNSFNFASYRQKADEIMTQTLEKLEAAAAGKTD